MKFNAPAPRTVHHASLRTAEFNNGSYLDDRTSYDGYAVDFVEMFNKSEDAWELRNIALSNSTAVKAARQLLQAKLAALRTCAGESCP